ncbi:MAG: hypothetical protein AUG51_13400 [Acidobacteria bacterium 13_1_20CM_3_53_8]|nr:MAG: hypothetical protein AUG51_13400 [Acidobacteria bacterium 13_1_20CM_3_53_8]
MYCQSCGSEMSAELNYCNRCGAINPAALMTLLEPKQVSLMKPTVAIGVVVVALTLGGMGMLIAGAEELARSAGFRTDPIMALIMFGMIMILAVDIMLVRLLSRIINHALDTPAKSLKPASAKSLKNLTGSQPAQHQLGARPNYVGSVTENTTRTLEHAKERGA